MGCVVTRELSISRQSVTPFFSASPTTCLNPSTQFLAPTSSGISSSYPVKQITFLYPYSAQASIASRVAFITGPQYLGLLKPFTNGGSGLISIWPMALVSPAALSCGKYLAGSSSMLSQPKPLALLMNSSIGQYFSKHQWTIDCLIRPFLTAGPWSA